MVGKTYTFQCLKLLERCGLVHELIIKPALGNKLLPINEKFMNLYSIVCNLTFTTFKLML